MKNIKKSLVSLAVGALTTAATFVVSAEELNRSNISEKFQSLTPFEVVAVENSPADSLYQIVTTQGVFYMTKDGKHIMSGALHAAAPGLPNLTQERIAQLGADKINNLKDSFITFEAENQKHEIVVFYDTTCPYCHRMHKELDALLESGVTVHYAGWPREGLVDRRNPGTDAMPNPSASYSELMGIFCDKNLREMLDANADGARIKPGACPNKIDEHYALGEFLGVRGTPAVFSVDGQQISPGYSPASVILERLQGAK